MQVIKLSKLIQKQPNMSSDQFWDSLIADLSLQRGKALHSACCFLYLSSDAWNSTRRHEACVQQLGCANMWWCSWRTFWNVWWWTILQLSLASLHGWAPAALHNKSIVTRWGDRSSRKEFPHTELLGGEVLSLQDSVYICEDFSAEIEPIFQVKPFWKHEIFNMMGRRYYYEIILLRYPPELAC